MHSKLTAIFTMTVLASSSAAATSSSPLTASQEAARFLQGQGRQCLSVVIAGDGERGNIHQVLLNITMKQKHFASLRYTAIFIHTHVTVDIPVIKF